MPKRYSCALSRKKPYLRHSKNLSHSIVAQHASRNSPTEPSKQKDIPSKYLSKGFDGRYMRFDDGSNFQSNLLIDHNQLHDGYVARHIAESAKLMNAQICQTTVNLSDPISVLNFRSTFKTTRHINKVLEGATMWLFHFFIWYLELSTTSAQNCFPDSSNTLQRGVFYSYCDVVDYLLATYATDNVIAEGGHNITNCSYPPNQSYVSYVQLL